MKRTGLILLVVVMLSADAAAGSSAAGGGVYDVEPGMASQFQLSSGLVQCKVSENVFMPKGLILHGSGFEVPFDLFFQMFMSSTSIDSFTVSGNVVTVTGTMVSIVVLQPLDGSRPIRLREVVPFTARGEDNAPANANDGTAGSDFFSLSVTYAATGGLDQADLFTTNATFAGFIKAGNVVVK